LVGSPGGHGAWRRSGFFRSIGDCLSAVVAELVSLDFPDKDGDTAHKRAEREGREPQHIDCPPEYDYLLDWFRSLSAARAEGFSGPCPISFRDIEAWASLTGEILLREEVAILRQMDAAYLDAISKAQKAEGNSETSQPQMSTATFDAMFG